jgi:peptide/nickel transport system permease protein
MFIQYLLRRLLWTLLTLCGVSVLTFLLVFAGPTDPARKLVGDKATGVSIDHIRQEYGLDQPLYVQYVTYMGRLLRGDLGESYYYRRPVAEALFSRLPATGLLALSIMFVSCLVGIPLGAYTAVRQNSLVDRLTMVLGLVAISLPTFFVGMLLMYCFSYQIKLFPVGGYGTLRHLVLPTLAVAIPWGAWYAIFLRSNMLETLSADYVRTAYAKGLNQRTVAVRHILRNALLPVVTIMGIDMASLLTGIVLVETVFSWPGIGMQTLQAAQHLDVPLIMGSVLFGAILIGLANLLIDIFYTWLDPRVQLS